MAGNAVAHDAARSGRLASAAAADASAGNAAAAATSNGGGAAFLSAASREVFRAGVADGSLEARITSRRHYSAADR